MKVFGWIFLVVGMLMVVSAWGMNVSVPGGMEGRIINNGLVADRMLMLATGGILSTIGTLLVTGARIIGVIALGRGESKSAVVADVVAEADGRVCPKCKHSVRVTERVCLNCGEDLASD